MVESAIPQRYFSSVRRRRLILVPRTTDDFRAAVSALSSIDGVKGKSFHAFSLSEYRCVLLLIKNWSGQVPEDVIREDLEALGMCPGSVAGMLRAPRPELF